MAWHKRVPNVVAMIAGGVSLILIMFVRTRILGYFMLAIAFLVVIFDLWRVHAKATRDFSKIYNFIPNLSICVIRDGIEETLPF